MTPEELPGYDAWKTTPPDDTEEDHAEAFGAETFGADDYEMFDGER